jgi:DNA mismatch repair protein MutS
VAKSNKTSSEPKLTPMMVQYRAMREEIPDDAVLMFRLGDFYEMFFEDASRAAPLLEVVLTSRGGVPMCGIPYHAIDTYLPRILSAGVKVAVAEQVEDPKQAKGIVKREIARIITPGTVVDSSVLSPSCHNYLVALVPAKQGSFGLASLDISTGDFRLTELNSVEDTAMELQRLEVRECVVPESAREFLAEDVEEERGGELRKRLGDQVCWTYLDDWIFSFDNANELLQRHFNVLSLDGFGCRGMNLGVSAAGAVLYYASENLRQEASHLKTLKTYKTGDYMVMDDTSIRNLEVVSPIREGAKESTLLSVLDFTSTPMGARLLREWLLRPLCDKDEIVRRLDAVSVFKDDPMIMGEAKELLAPIRDLERIMTRMNIGSGNARDAIALASSLDIVPHLRNILKEYDMPLLCEMRSGMSECSELVDEINATIAEEPPATLSDGGIIKKGVDSTLDELRSAATEGKGWIAALQVKEQEKTGIKALKIRYNRVFGYYIEVSNGSKHLVPEEYIRKQTLTNGERYITPELKEFESKILGAEEKSKALEYQMFQDLRLKTLEFTAKIQQTAANIAALDVLLSFAEAASKRNYCRPRITNDEVFKVEAGRHPVLDATLTSERFVPNDIEIDAADKSMMIITGPNMAGKSTYIRQIALLALLAQTGSYIPATKAEIGLVDRVFTRVGASDDISRGQSTFMVEMIETANILNHATNKSLVILDEIGRGTSTFDGISIAWAVAEHLLDNNKCRARTLFATHYHELAELALTRKGVGNYNVAVREYQDKIIFLRQILPGTSDKSYGIHVAKLAGLPQSVVDRANEILGNLENNAIGQAGQPALVINSGFPPLNTNKTEEIREKVIPPKKRSKTKSKKSDGNIYKKKKGQGDSMNNKVKVPKNADPLLSKSSESSIELLDTKSDQHEFHQPSLFD